MLVKLLGWHFFMMWSGDEWRGGVTKGELAEKLAQDSSKKKNNHNSRLRTPFWGFTSGVVFFEKGFLNTKQFLNCYSAGGLTQNIIKEPRAYS